MRIKIKAKIIVDIILFLSGLSSIVSGLILLILPSGPGTGGGLTAASSSIFDLTTRGGLRFLHDWSSILLVAFIFFHLVLNWRLIICYAKNAFKTAV
ncbi:MAG TPA: hypothetical protein DCP02_02175 [Actinobacteria bacterium]|nr:hypothetical protein [Actinomycetota bacterium]